MLEMFPISLYNTFHCLLLEKQILWQPKTSLPLNMLSLGDYIRTVKGSSQSDLVI